MDGGLSETPFIPQLLLERSIRHERVSDVGERAMTLNCHIVGLIRRTVVDTLQAASRHRANLSRSPSISYIES